MQMGQRPVHRRLRNRGLGPGDMISTKIDLADYEVQRWYRGIVARPGVVGGAVALKRE
jgi:hypothetical protein